MLLSVMSPNNKRSNARTVRRNDALVYKMNCVRKRINVVSNDSELGLG